MQLKRNYLRIKNLIYLLKTDKKETPTDSHSNKILKLTEHAFSPKIYSIKAFPILEINFLIQKTHQKALVTSFSYLNCIWLS